MAQVIKGEMVRKRIKVGDDFSSYENDCDEFAKNRCTKKTDRRYRLAKSQHAGMSCYWAYHGNTHGILVHVSCMSSDAYVDTVLQDAYDEVYDAFVVDGMIAIKAKYEQREHQLKRAAELRLKAEETYKAKQEALKRGRDEVSSPEEMELLEKLADVKRRREETLNAETPRPKMTDGEIRQSVNTYVETPQGDTSTSPGLTASTGTGTSSEADASSATTGTSRKGRKSQGGAQ